MKSSKDPFRFHSRFVLSFAAGRTARNLAELRAGIAELPDAVLYQHTHSFLAGHESLVPDLSNDFAPWVADALDDPATAERLAAVDVPGFNNFSELRAAFLSLLDESLRRGPGRYAPDGGAFRFMSAVRYSVPLGIEARTLAEFIEAVKRVGPSSLYLHLYESRLRGGGTGDFSRWLDMELGEPALAAAAGDLNLYGWTLDDVRRRLVDLLENALEGGAGAQAR